MVVYLQSHLPFSFITSNICNRRQSWTLHISNPASSGLRIVHQTKLLQDKLSTLLNTDITRKEIPFNLQNFKTHLNVTFSAEYFIYLSVLAFTYIYNSSRMTSQTHCWLISQRNLISDHSFAIKSVTITIFFFSWNTTKNNFNKSIQCALHMAK
jgi:hypothetical protein